MRHPLSQRRHRTELTPNKSEAVQSFLIIGCGSCDRGDDAAGLLAVAELRKFGIHAVGCSGESSALIELWRAADQVIVIDAVRTGAAPGTIHLWDVHAMQMPSQPGRSTHSLGVAQAIDLARTLQLLPPHLSIIGIEGRSFELGAHPSAETESAVHEVVEKILQEVGSSVMPFRRL